jgi:hypothetical protein
MSFATYVMTPTDHFLSSVKHPELFPFFHSDNITGIYLWGKQGSSKRAAMLGESAYHILHSKYVFDSIRYAIGDRHLELPSHTTPCHLKTLIRMLFSTISGHLSIAHKAKARGLSASLTKWSLSISQRIEGVSVLEHEHC